MKHSKYEEAIVELDPGLFERAMATTTNPNTDPEEWQLDPDQLSVLYKNCITVEVEGITGDLVVGAKVTYHEEQCPMDNCNGWCSGKPVPVTIRFLGTVDQCWEQLRQEPTYQLWYWLQ
jgi:hypothetical protein